MTLAKPTLLKLVVDFPYFRKQLILRSTQRRAYFLKLRNEVRLSYEL